METRQKMEIKSFKESSTFNIISIGIELALRDHFEIIELASGDDHAFFAEHWSDLKDLVPEVSNSICLKAETNCKCFHY